MSVTTHNPFALSQVNSGVLKSVIQAVSKIDVLEGWYEQWYQNNNGQCGDTDEFIAYTLDKLGVLSQVVNDEKLADIPQEGAFIFVANHPLGGIEGVMLTQILRRIRPDLKVLTNEMLSSIPELSDVFIGVDVLNQNKAQYNSKGMREVTRHISKGGALLVFPAGTVSQIRIPSLKVIDAPWNAMISRLAKKYDAPVMPVFVEGENSKLFYLSAYIHKRLRTLLLPRAMVSKAGETIRLHFSAPIPAADIRRIGDDAIAMHYIRLCCKVLGSSQHTCADCGHESMEEIKNDLCSQKISEHLIQLQEFLLYKSGDLAVYCAPYKELGPVMEQLSIERERTFRAVDEGTGKELDSDRFDPHYLHLFLWDKAAQKFAGGYRLGRTDEIYQAHGLDGLYSHSLFDYDAKFLNNMGKTIEVGRSFVAQDYQKNPKALDMLWKGIGHYVAKNPEYHTLFGCVSISRQYSALARAMLTETFLSHYGVEDSIANKVKARVPQAKLDSPWTSDQLASLSEIPIINKLVGRIDQGMVVPVLIRHYLALSGRFISFTVNNSFNDALDGLIMVDLRNTSARYLKRYMGEQGMGVFHNYHSVNVRLDSAQRS